MGTVFKARGELVVNHHPDVICAIKELNEYFTDSAGEAVLIFLLQDTKIKLEFDIDESGTVHCADHFESALDDIRPHIIEGGVFEMENFGDEYLAAIDINEVAAMKRMSDYRISSAAEMLSALTDEERRAAIRRIEDLP